MRLFFCFFSPPDVLFCLVQEPLTDFMVNKSVDRGVNRFIGKVCEEERACFFTFVKLGVLRETGGSQPGTGLFGFNLCRKESEKGHFRGVTGDQQLLAEQNHWTSTRNK